MSQASPTQVWSFMADFSNYKYLNPHLLEWRVLEDRTKRKEKGSEWSYVVRYSEFYEHIPLLTNTATGNYSVFQDHESQVTLLVNHHLFLLNIIN